MVYVKVNSINKLKLGKKKKKITAQFHERIQIDEMEKRVN